MCVCVCIQQLISLVVRSRKSHQMVQGLVSKLTSSSEEKLLEGEDGERLSATKGCALLISFVLSKLALSPYAAQYSSRSDGIKD